MEMSWAHSPAHFILGIYPPVMEDTLTLQIAACVCQQSLAVSIPRCALTAMDVWADQVLVDVSHSSRAGELMLHLNEDIFHPRPQVLSKLLLSLPSVGASLPWCGYHRDEVRSCSPWSRCCLQVWSPAKPSLERRRQNQRQSHIVAVFPESAELLLWKPEPLLLCVCSTGNWNNRK